MDRKAARQFANRLKELREGAGLTQQQLAERAGTHKLTVAKLEQAIREPSWATVQALAAALCVDCVAFTQEAGSHPPQGRGRPARAKEAKATPRKPRGRPRKGE